MTFSRTLARCFIPLALLAAPGAVLAQEAPQSALGAYLSGRVAEAEHDMDAAARFYTVALEDDAGNAELRRRAFQADVAAGSIERALVLAQDLARDPDTGPLARLVLAAGAAKKGDFVAARTNMEAVQESGANRLLKPGFLAWIEFGRGDAVGAEKELRAIAGIEGLRVFLDLHLALIYDAAGRNADAERMYRGAMGNDDNGPLRVTQAFAGFLARTGRTQDAVALWNSYLAAAPDSSIAEIARQRLNEGKVPPRLAASAPEGMAELLLNVAGALQQDSANVPALIYVRLADYLRPKNPDTLYVLAGLLDSLDQEEAAVDIYGSIPRDSDLSWSARRAEAADLVQLKRVDDAAALLEDMAKERPERWDALLLLGNLWRSEKQYEKAVHAYDRAVNRIPKLEARHWNLLYVRGIANERAKHWPQAEADFKEALKLKPNEPYVLNYLAYTWVDRGEHLEEAKKMLDEAVRQKPDDGAIVDSVGWAYYRLGQPAKALEYIERAVELTPDDPAINEHLGDIYWSVGRHMEARFQWHRALSLNPDPDDVPKLKNKIENGLPANTGAKP